MLCVLFRMVVPCLLPVAALARPPSASECAVWQRELAFAQSVERHDAAAFARFIDPGAVFNAASDNPARGKPAILASWSEILGGKGVTLRWRPQHVSVTADGRLAMSRGPYFLATRSGDGRWQYAVGTFTSVWVRSTRRQPWRIALDGAGAAPQPVASEAEATAHLGTTTTPCR